MRLSLWQQVTEKYNRGVISGLFRDVENAIAQITDGKAAAISNAATAAPTGGNWSMGDFVKKSDPAEAGTAGSKYVIVGWICVTAGTPGTWLECRYLTGN